MIDVAVVGGGIAGAAAACFLAEAGASVAVYEAESTCDTHATGRSAALFTEAYAAPELRRLAIASRSFLEQPPAGFTDAALVAPRGLLFVARDDQGATLDREYAAAREHVPEVRRIETPEAVAMCPVLDPAATAAAFLEPGAMDIDVHALHQGYLRRLRSLGGVVHTSTPVTGLRAGPQGWTVETPAGAELAGVVVDAAGAWCDVVAGFAGVEPLGLRPLRRTVFLVDLPARPEGWPMVVDVDEQWYFRPEGAGLLCSPADEGPSEPCDARHREEDVALGIERINAATTLAIRSVRTAWAGLRSFVADRLPVAGFDPDHPGFFWLAGQGGSGIKTSPALGMLAADLIVMGEPRRDLTSAGVDPDTLSPGRLRRTAQG